MRRRKICGASDTKQNAQNKTRARGSDILALIRALASDPRSRLASLAKRGPVAQTGGAADSYRHFLFSCQEKRTFRATKRKEPRVRLCRTLNFFLLNPGAFSFFVKKEKGPGVIRRSGVQIPSGPPRKYFFLKTISLLALVAWFIRTFAHLLLWAGAHVPTRLISSLHYKARRD